MITTFDHFILSTKTASNITQVVAMTNSSVIKVIVFVEISFVVNCL